MTPVNYVHKKYHEECIGLRDTRIKVLEAENERLNAIIEGLVDSLGPSGDDIYETICEELQDGGTA